MWHLECALEIDSRALFMNDWKTDLYKIDGFAIFTQIS